MIMAKDVMDIIKSDYDDEMAFTLIEFMYNDKQHTMDFCVLPPDADESKEYIVCFSGQDI